MSPGNTDGKVRVSGSHVRHGSHVSGSHVRHGSNTPSATSTRNELMWENFPDASEEHWQKLNRTPHGVKKALWSPLSTKHSFAESMSQLSERNLDDLYRRTIVDSDMNELLEDECLTNGIKRYSDNERFINDVCSSNQLYCKCSGCEFGLTKGIDYEDKFQTDVGNFCGSNNTVDEPVLATVREPFETRPRSLASLNGMKYTTGGSKDSWSKFTDDRHRGFKENYERDAYDEQAGSSCNASNGRTRCYDEHQYRHQPQSKKINGPTDENLSDTYSSLDRQSSYTILGSERERQHLLPKNNLQFVPTTSTDPRLDLDWDDSCSAALPSIPLFPVTAGGTSIEGKLLKRETSYALHGKRMPPAMSRRKWANGEKQGHPKGFINNYSPCRVEKSSVNSVKRGFENSPNLNSCWRYQSVQTGGDSQRHCHGGSNGSRRSGNPERFESKSRASSRSERRCPSSRAHSGNQYTPDRYFSGRSRFTSDSGSRQECPPRRSRASISCGESCSLIAAYLPILYSHGCFRQILHDYRSCRPVKSCKHLCDSVAKFIPMQSLGSTDSSGRKTPVNGSVNRSTRSDWDPQSPMGRDVVDVMINQNARSVKEQTKVKSERFIPENNNSWLTVADNGTQTRCTKTANSTTQVKPSVRHMCNQTTNKTRSANKHCQTNSRKRDSNSQVTPTNRSDAASQVVLEDEYQSSSQVTDSRSWSSQDLSTNQTVVQVYSPDLLTNNSTNASQN